MLSGCLGKVNVQCTDLGIPGEVLKINVISGRAEADRVEGTAALIDIFRATSTIPVLLFSGAVAVYPFPKMRDARKFARQDESTVTVGERFGIRIPGFHFNNSPSDVMDADLEGRKIAFTSTNGTKVLGMIPEGVSVVTASFINHTATLKWLSERDEIWLVRSDRPDGKSEEDQIYAEFLERSLKGEEPDFDLYAEKVRNCNGARTLDMLGYRKDVEMALRIDMVDFPVFYRDGRFVRG